MQPLPESVFDLGLLTNHLEVKLEWATQHHLTAGSHATSAAAPTLALWLVETGAVRVRFSNGDSNEEEETIVRQNDAILMGTERHRTISALQDVTWLSAGFTLRLFSRDYTQNLFPRVFQWQPDATANQTLHTLLSVAQASCRITQLYLPSPFPFRHPTDSVQQWVADGVARGLIHQMWEACKGAGVLLPVTNAGETPAWLLSVLLHISQTPATASVDSMSRIAGISLAQFNRLFRRFVGTSPQKQLILARLQNASRLLLTTEKTIAVIAQSVGFESVSHFTRLFTEHYQESPARFRVTQRNLRL